MAGNVLCPRCGWQILLGSVSAGIKVKCPKCAAVIQLSGAPASGKTGAGMPGVAPHRPQAAGASQSRLQRSTPIMRKVNRSSGFPRKSHGEGDEGEGRRRLPEKKSSTGLFVGLGIGVVILVIIVIAATSGGEKKPVKKKASAAPQVSALPKPPDPGPPPIPEKFLPNTENLREKIANVSEDIDPERAKEVDGLLKDSAKKNGDSTLRGKICANFKKSFPVLVDRLATDDEAIFFEAANVINIICLKIDVKVEGKAPIDMSNPKRYNDPEKRALVYETFAGNWKKLKGKVDSMPDSLFAGAPVEAPRPDGTPPNSSTPPDAPPDEQPVVQTDDLDRLLRKTMGADEIDAAAKALESRKPGVYKELVKFIGEDLRVSRNAVELLNILAGRERSDNLPKENNWQQIKQTWENWASQNGGN
ncbi:MAG: hypothetical protein A2Z34_02375 [Planctomycetes bacterium RBG_16_59_8]|nr:MAG: hypothetical protein A2Z34_02375 [Planctomycetes bacterium RBG_16_59_8]